MDPMQTWILILASWKEADWDSLFEYSDALIEWTDRMQFQNWTVGWRVVESDDAPPAEGTA